MKNHYNRILALLCAVLLTLTSYVLPVVVNYAASVTEGISSTLFADFDTITADTQSLEWRIEKTTENNPSFTMVYNSAKAPRKENIVTIYATQGFELEPIPHQDATPERRIVPDLENPGQTREEKIIALDTTMWRLTKGVEGVYYNETTQVYEVVFKPTTSIEKVTFPFKMVDTSVNYGLIAIEATGDKWNKALYEKVQPLADPLPEVATEELMSEAQSEGKTTTEQLTPDDLMLRLTAPIATYFETLTLKKAEALKAEQEKLEVASEITTPEEATAMPTPEAQRAEETEAPVEAKAPVPVLEQVESSQPIDAPQEVVATVPLIEESSLLTTENVVPTSEQITSAPLMRSLLTGGLMGERALTSSNPNNGGGNLINGTTTYGNYTWSASAAADGSYVDWSITVNKTTTGTAASARVQFAVNGQHYSSLTNLIVTKNGTAGESASTSDPYYFRSQNTTIRATDTYWLTVKFRTAVQASQLAEPEFVFPIKPFVLAGTTHVGPNNTTSGSGSLPSLLPINMSVANPTYSPNTDVTINKTGVNHTPLAGARFSLVGIGATTGNYQSTMSNAAGVATFTGVTPGTYTLTETVVPAGYTGAAPRQVTIDGNNKTFTVENTQTPYRIQIASKDQNGAGIVGVSYTVFNTTTQQTVGTFTTETGGVVTTGQLAAGNSYSVTQTSVPQGYTATATSPVTIVNLQPGTTPATFTNTIDTTTNVTVNLKKSNTTINIPGAKFQIWTTGANPIAITAERTTDSVGNVTFIGVPNGQKYEVRQLSTPVPYSVASSQELDLTGVIENGTRNMQFYNSDVTLSVNLKAHDTQTNLPGAVFVAKQGTLEISGPITTDADGNAVLSGLSIGQTYTIEEVTAPPGYMPYPPVTVDMRFQTHFLEVTNVPLTMRVTLQAPGGAPIAGGNFVLKHLNGDIVSGPITTTAEGVALFTGPALIYGETYTVEQTATPDGYKLAQPQTATVNSALTTVPFTNGQDAKLNITLYESFSATPLAGGIFVIKDENFNIIGPAQTTGADGKVTFTGLEDRKTYTIEQLAAPTGYIPIAPKIYVQDGTEYHQPIFNSKGTVNTSSIKITSVDKENPTLKLAGSEFRVTDPNGATYVVTTNSEGVAILTNLPNGEYTMVQTKAPGGYLPEPTALTQTLTNQLLETTFTSLKTGTTLMPAIIKTTVREGDLFTGPPIADVTIRATDNLGNVHYATTDGNGVLYFSGLDVTRRYRLEVVDAPMVYGNATYWPEAQLDIGFTDLTTPFYRETLFKLDRAPVNDLYINVYEKGDVRVKIPGAQVVLVYPDGTERIYTTDIAGFILVKGLTRDFDYTIRQVTSDAQHQIDPVTQSFYLLREESVDFENPLKDVTSVKRDVQVTKAWGDPKPANVSGVTFTLYADGVSTGATRTIAGGTGTAVFSGQRKYNDHHGMIKYTVVETAIPDFYGVHEKLDVDGYTWKVTNYEGSLIGNCTTGTWWQSNSSTATEYDQNGHQTGTTINLGGTYGYGIALTPLPTADGKQYLFGMDREGKLTMHDIGKPKDQTFVSSSVGKLVSFSGEWEHYANSLEISADGKWMYAAGEYNRDLKIFNTEAVISAMKNGTALPSAVRTITLPSQRGFAGDIVELPNGDLLMSTYDSVFVFPNFTLRGTGLYIAPKTGDGMYGSPKYVGNVQFPEPAAENRLEAMSLVYPNGPSSEPKIVFTAYSGTKWMNYTMNSLPAYNDNKTFGVTLFGDEPGSKSADATSGSLTPCSAEIKVIGTKTWVGDTVENRPISIRVELLQNGKSMAPRVTQDVVKDANDNWIYTFEGLPKYDAVGNRYRYSVSEIGYTDNTGYHPGILPGYLVTNPPADPGTQGVLDTTIVNTLLKGSFNLRKTDESDRPLSGAEFTLYGAMGVPMGPDLSQVIRGPEVVNDQGWLAFTDLPLGTYFLKETKAPPGYALSTTYYRVAVTKNANNDVVVKVYSDQYGSTELGKESNGTYIILNRPIKTGFTLKKVDGVGNILQGAVFTLTQGTSVSEHTVGTTGEIKFENLSPGNYTLKETHVPNGYHLNHNVYHIAINEQGVVTIRLNDPDNGLVLPHDPFLIIANYAKGEVVVKKVDEAGNPIAGNGTDIGAQFTLKGEPPLVYEKVVTVGVDGLAKFEQLDPGTYTLTETKAPEGYIGEPRTYKVMVADDGKVTVRLGEQDVSTQPVVIVNKKGTHDITIKKVDENGNILPGTKLTLFEADKTTPVKIFNEDGTLKVVYEAIEINLEGTFKFEGLETETDYYLKETHAVEGYVADPVYYKIRFHSNGEVTIDPDNKHINPSPDTLGNYVFTNYPVGEYPATGGMGTLPYILIGVILMAIGYYDIRKRERKGGVKPTWFTKC